MAKSVLADLVLRLSTNSAELKRGLAEAKTSLSGLDRNSKNIGSQVSTSLAKMGAAFAAVGGTIEFFKSALLSTGESADKFAKIQEGLKQGFDAIKRAVVTLDFKDFVKNVKGAINEGMRYAETLDDIDEKTRELKIQEADASNELIKQQKILRSALSSSDQKKAAGEEIIKTETKLALIRTGIADQAYQNELTNIASITKLTNLEVEAILRGEKTAKDKIAAGKEYNKMLSDQTTLENDMRISGINRIPITQNQIDQLAELKKKLGATSEETKKYAYATAKMSDDPKLNLAVSKYVDLQAARRSADEDTIKTATRLDAIDNKQITTQDKLKTVEEARLENAKEKARIDERNAKYSSVPTKIKFGDPKLSSANIAPGLQKGPTNLYVPTITGNLERDALAMSRDISLEKIRGDEDEANKRYEIWRKYHEDIADLNQLDLENSRKIKEDKLVMAQTWLNAVGEMINTVANINVISMNKEIEAAGNSETAKERIRRKYARKQKATAIATALINGALAITDVWKSWGAYPIVAGILSGVAAVAVGAQVGVISSQSLAKGGIAYSPTLATVGEYPGARTNPEIITPLNKLKDILGKNKSEVVFIIEGTQLRGVLNNIDRKINSFS
jgi:hypothetical protein